MACGTHRHRDRRWHRAAREQGYQGNCLRDARTGAILGYRATGTMHMDAAVLHEVDGRFMHKAELKCVRLDPLFIVSNHLGGEKKKETIRMHVERMIGARI